jgi:hypothetical protein
MVMTKAMRRDDVYKAVAPTANAFVTEVQAVWAEKDLQKKKDLAISTIIDKFEFPAKAIQFRKKILEAKTTMVIDLLVGDISLYASGDRVIKLY